MIIGKQITLTPFYNSWISVAVRVNLTEGKVALAIDIMDKRT